MAATLTFLAWQPIVLLPVLDEIVVVAQTGAALSSSQALDTKSPATPPVLSHEPRCSLQGSCEGPGRHGCSSSNQCAWAQALEADARQQSQ